MGAYDAAAAAARRILGKKGRPVVMVRPGQGAPNPITGRRAAGADLQAVFNCVALPPGRSAEYAIGSLVGRRITEFHLARTSGDLDPQPGDVLPWGGKDYTVVWSAVYDPDDEGMVYAKAYGEI